MRDVHVTVAAVVEREGRFLFVEETVADRAVINQPAGHWERGETLADACAREALEETAWEIRPTALLGVYEYHPAELPHGFLRFAFRATALKHHAGRPLDTGILRAVWLTPEDLRAELARHRSPMVQRCVDDFLAGTALPLDAVAHL